MSDPICKLPDYTIDGIGSIETLSEIFPQNITSLNIPKIWKRTKGKGVIVAVLDTGIHLHHDIDKNLDISKCRSFIPNENIFDNVNGHGIHVSGIIAAQLDEKGIVGVAPEVTIVSVKVLNRFGFSQDNSIVKGLKYCLELQPDIINLSLGSESPMPEALEVLKKLVKQNIIVVASAGNTQKEGLNYPACYDETIAVGSCSNALFKSRSLFSSWGKELDIIAPGEEIFSTYLHGKYAVLSGTSQAAPHVSGIIALIASQYKQQGKVLTLDTVKKILLDNATDVGMKGFDNETGWGIIDPDKMFATLFGEPIPQKISFWQKIKNLFKKK